MTTVVFHRNFRRFQGGHLKVFHYFEHVRSSPGHSARIRFSPESVWDASNPWAAMRETVIEPGETVRADIMFLAGMDWLSLEPGDRAASPVPIINLIQDFRAGRGASPLHEFLACRAIRICVSPEIQDQLQGSVEGPIFTVPVSFDLKRLPSPRPAEQRDIDCVVLAIKEPRLGRSIAERLLAAGHRVMLVDSPIPRDDLLEAIARTRVTVHLPASREGAYLPALESMALGAAVVCPDCVGNRSFCRDGDTALVPRRSERAILKSALTALTASPHELAPMLSSAHRESMSRGLDSERSRFLEILERVGELWEGG